MNAIECDSLSRSFGATRAVDAVSLVVPEGSIFALLGPNGSGKTTTLKMLLNLLRPSSGSVKVLGVDSRELTKDHFQRIGYVTEDQKYHEWMTVEQMVAYYRPLYRRWNSELFERLDKRFGLPKDRPLGKLSRGMRVKAILLATLPFEPELLVLDEPFGGLDPQVRDDFINAMLEAIDSDKPHSVIVSSHDIAEVERLADWVGILQGGRLVMSSPMDDLLGRFRRLEVRGVAASFTDPAALPEGWVKIERPLRSSVAQVIDSRFTGADEAARKVRQVFGEQAAFETYPMGLREIYLSYVSTERSWS